MKWLQKKDLIIVLLLMFMFVFIVNVSAVTGKIGNARVVLYPEINGKTTIDRTIQVINDNDFPVNINISESDEYKGIIQVEDKGFTLQAGEQKDAKFKIVLTKTGNYDGNVIVYFKKEGDKQGVALASRIIIHATGKGQDGVYDNNSVKDSDVKGTSISGNSVKASLGKISPVFIILGITTLICIIVLIYLIDIKSKMKNEGVLPTKTTKTKKNNE